MTIDELVGNAMGALAVAALPAAIILLIYLSYKAKSAGQEEVE